MSISTVVTMGYGTFGSVNLIPWLGYGDAISEVASHARLVCVMSGHRMETSMRGRLECASPETQSVFALPDSRPEVTLPMSQYGVSAR